MTIVIWISIGCFLLLPYYLSVFSLEKKFLKGHIGLWLIFHTIFVVLGYVFYEEWFTSAAVLLICYTLYYLFSYIFYVKDISDKVSEADIKNVANDKMVRKISKCCLWIIGVLSIVEIVFIYIMNSFGLEQVYFSAIVAISFIQVVYYCNIIREKYLVR